jgi:hypothetical protein
MTSGLPVVLADLSPDQVRDRLDAAARRGRLPGLNLETPCGAFEIRDFGHPFESSLIASIENSGEKGVRITFDTKVRPLVPWIFAVALVLSIWPGIYLVDSMLHHTFSWYNIPTWWWYLPLSVPTSPWAFASAMKKSRHSATADARQLIQKVAGELKGRIVDSPAGV